MRIQAHKQGLDILGGELFDGDSLGNDITLGADTNHAILIKVKNAGELARSQGSVAAFAQSIAPSTIENKVYSAMVEQLRNSFKEKNVDADVSIVDPKGWQPADGTHLWTDVGIGLGILGIVAISWRLLAGGSK